MVVRAHQQPEHNQLLPVQAQTVQDHAQLDEFWPDGDVFLSARKFPLARD